MPMLKIRKGFCCLLFAAVASLAAALPGVDRAIPDFSGEYVYYKDNTFKNESIVGFLYYDEATYAVRYYSPAAAAAKQPEKDITIYFSVNPDKAVLELTGETVVGSSDSADDVDIVNYLHDLFYEFSARRRKAPITDAVKLDVPQDFAQFGGTVTLSFNTRVPIFNLVSIKAVDGSPLFQLETAGLLADSADTSFASFKGVNGLPVDKKRAFSKNRSAKSAALRFEEQSLAADTQWTQSMENLWLLGDSALVSMNVISIPAAFAEHPELFKELLIRKSCQGTTGSYALWQHAQVQEKGKAVTVTNVFYQPENGDVTRDFKVLTDIGGGRYAYLTLTVFDSIYQKNKSYFNKILKSYRAQ